MNKIFLAFSVFMMSIGIYAADSSSGCGLGWQIFRDNSLVSSSLRATTNSITLNTIGMTLGTSGCAKHSIVKNESKGIHFAEANMDQLMLEMAQGQGEFVAGFANVIGCQPDSFARGVQKNYNKIFTSEETSAGEMYKNLKFIVGSDEFLARSCAII